MLAVVLAAAMQSPGAPPPEAQGTQATQGAPPASRPIPATKHNAEAAFMLDAARCVFSVQHGVGGIEALPAKLTAGLRPTTTAERFLFKDSAVKVWAQDPFGAHVLLSEPAPMRCEVVADQLNVEETLVFAEGAIRKAIPTAVETPAKSDYSDHVHQLEWSEAGSHFVVRLEGSEPGGFAHPGRMLAGHAYRFSILHARVTRELVPSARLRAEPSLDR